MKNVINPVLAGLILTGISATAVASPAVIDGQAFDAQPRYTVGEIDTAPRHLNLADTFEPEFYQDHYEQSPLAEYVEGVADPLVKLPKLTWVFN